MESLYLISQPLRLLYILKIDTLFDSKCKVMGVLYQIVVQVKEKLHVLSSYVFSVIGFFVSVLKDVSLQWYKSALCSIVLHHRRFVQTFLPQKTYP